MNKQDLEKAIGEAPQNITDKRLANFLTQAEAAAELNICERTLDRWPRLGEEPPIAMLRRRIVYRRSSVQVWLRAREGDAA
jgi:hypothetical protein